MDLKAALALAGKYTDDKAPGLNCVSLRDGFVRAHNGVSGITVPCEAADLGLSVDCAALGKMIALLGGGIGGPQLKVKGKKLEVSAGGSKFTLAALTGEEGAALLDFPEPSSKAAWGALTAQQVAAVAAVAATAPKKDGGTFATSGLRITPTWFASATQTGVAVAWVQGAVAKPVTVSAAIWTMEGPCEIAVGKDGKVFVRDEQGVVRWGSAMSGEWPDSAVDDMIGTARADPNRTNMTINLEEFQLLLRQAAVVSEGRLCAFKMVLRGGSLAIEGDNKLGKGGGSSAFKGDMDVPGLSGVDKTIGISPDHMSLYTGAASETRSATYRLSVGGPSDSILCWGLGAEDDSSHVVVETLCLPQHLNT